MTQAPAETVDTAGVPDAPSPISTTSGAPTATAAVVAVVAGLAVAWVVGAGHELGDDVRLLLLAGPAVGALSILAVRRFEWFVWVVLLVRPSLDAIGGLGGLGAGAMLSALFLATASTWLLAQRRVGSLRRLSVTSRALLWFAGAVTASVVTSQVVLVSARAALEVLAGISLFLVLEQLLPGRLDRVRRLFGAVLASAVVPVAVALVEWSTGGGRALGEISRIEGTFVHPNPFATYLVLVTTVALTAAGCVRGRARTALAFTAVVLAGVVILTYSRGGWIALLLAVGYLGYRLRRWVPVVMAAAAALAAVFVPPVRARIDDLSDDRWVPEGVPRNSFEWRLQYWADLIPMVGDSPATGIGPQAILTTRPEALEPHNVLVQVLVEMGLVGLVGLVAVIATITVTLVRRRRAGSIHVERVLASGAIAAGLSVVVQLPSENLLTQTMTWWYLAAAMSWGFVATPSRTRPSEPEHPTAVAGLHTSTV